MIDFMKLQAVIWDMDGVLVDSEPIHLETWWAVFDQFNIKIHQEQLKRVFGMTSEMTIRTLSDRPLDDRTINAMIQEKARKFQEEIRERAVILPGVRGWLDSFESNGIRQAVASSGKKKNIEIVLDKLRIDSYFGVVLDGDGLPSKPQPHIFLKTAEMLDVIPLNCLVIEDSVAGIKAAKAAGMQCVGVGTTNPLEALSEADVAVENLAQLTTEQVRALFVL